MPQIDPATAWPNYREDDFSIKDYRFASGEALPELRLHYRTMGVPRRDTAGKIVNGVLLLQGNTGTGANWLRPSLADELYGPGQPLDATQYFFVMQDAIGRGGSSKPSDGLRGNFPHYRYRDMVESGYRLISEHLGVGHLRLVIGSSMGGMHAWMWAEMYPDLMDGVVPLSCQPVEISGRNWLGRRAAAEAIRHDPDWNGGFYDENLRHYIYSAAGNFGTESPTRIQEMAPTLAAANALYEPRLDEAGKGDARPGAGGSGGVDTAVIASAAKQSPSGVLVAGDCFVASLLAMTGWKKSSWRRSVRCGRKRRSRYSCHCERSEAISLRCPRRR